jgi:hypothetical protein
MPPFMDKMSMPPEARAEDGRRLPMRTNRLSPRWWSVAAVAMAGFLFLWGAYINFSDFLGNLLSLGSLALGVFIAVEIVERLIERYREERWRKVRAVTLRAIATHIVDFYTTAWLDLAGNAPPGKILDGRGSPSLQSGEEMVNSLRVLRERCRTRDDEDSERFMHNVRNMYENARWNLDQIRSILLPRVLEISEDVELIQGLLRLDEAYRQWENARIVDQQVGIGYRAILEEILCTLETAARAYQLIVQRLPSGRPDEPVRASATPA